MIQALEDEKDNAGKGLNKNVSDRRLDNGPEAAQIRARHSAIVWP
jgi:hypothetical protein